MRVTAAHVPLQADDLRRIQRVAAVVRKKARAAAAEPAHAVSALHTVEVAVGGGNAQKLSLFRLCRKSVFCRQNGGRHPECARDLFRALPAPHAIESMVHKFKLHTPIVCAQT